MFGSLLSKRKAIEKRLPELDTCNMDLWLAATSQIESFGNRAVAPLTEILLADPDTPRSPTVVVSKKVSSKVDARAVIRELKLGEIAVGDDSDAKDIKAGGICVGRNATAHKINATGIYVGDEGIAQDITARFALVGAKRKCRRVHASFIFVGCRPVKEVSAAESIHWVNGDPVGVIALGCNRQSGIIRCLARLRDPKCLDALLQAGNSDNDWVRKDAFTAINAIGAEHCVEQLERLFHDARHKDARRLCMNVLRRAESARAREVFESLKALEETAVQSTVTPSEPPATVQNADTASEESAEDQDLITQVKIASHQFGRREIEILDEIAHAGTDESLDQLRRVALSDEVSGVARVHAIRQLLRHKVDIGDVVREALAEFSYDRQVLLSALVEDKAPNLTEILEEFLRTAEPLDSDRVTALRHLSELDPDGDIERLRKFSVEDDYWKLRQQAVQRLGELDCNIADLIPRWLQDQLICGDAIRVIKTQPSHEFLEPLADVARSGPSTDQGEAVEAIALINGDRATQILRDLSVNGDTLCRPVAMEKLAARAVDLSTDAIKWLKDDHSGNRRTAVSIVERRQLATCVEILESMVREDESASVQLAAVDAVTVLCEVTGRDVNPFLRNVVGHAPGGPDSMELERYDVRCHAMTKLFQTDADITDDLVEWLSDACYFVRFEAVVEAGRRRVKAAAERLAAIAKNDAYHDSRSAAVYAFWKVGGDVAAEFPEWIGDDALLENALVIAAATGNRALSSRVRKYERNAGKAGDSNRQNLCRIALAAIEASGTGGSVARMITKSAARPDKLASISDELAALSPENHQQLATVVINDLETFLGEMLFIRTTAGWNLKLLGLDVNVADANDANDGKQQEQDVVDLAGQLVNQSLGFSLFTPAASQSGSGADRCNGVLTQEEVEALVSRIHTGHTTEDAVVVGLEWLRMQGCFRNRDVNQAVGDWLDARQSNR